jgi:hypothetical protein
VTVICQLAARPSRRPTSRSSDSRPPAGGDRRQGRRRAPPRRPRNPALPAQTPAHHRRPRPVPGADTTDPTRPKRATMSPFRLCRTRTKSASPRSLKDRSGRLVSATTPWSAPRSSTWARACARLSTSARRAHSARRRRRIGKRVARRRPALVRCHRDGLRACLLDRARERRRGRALPMAFREADAEALPSRRELRRGRSRPSG